MGDTINSEDFVAVEPKMALRMATKRWVHVAGFSTLDAVVAFVNANPPQAAGEVVVVPVGGKFDVLIYI